MHLYFLVFLYWPCPFPLQYNEGGVLHSIWGHIHHQCFGKLHHYNTALQTDDDNAYIATNTNYYHDQTNGSYPLTRCSCCCCWRSLPKDSILENFFSSSSALSLLWWLPSSTTAAISEARGDVVACVMEHDEMDSTTTRITAVVLQGFFMVE